jgi:hypothetical protein
MSPSMRNLRSERGRCAMLGGFVGGPVLPAPPEDTDPSAGEDANGVGMIAAAGEGPAINVGGPSGGVAGVSEKVVSAERKRLLQAHRNVTPWCLPKA